MVELEMMENLLGQALSDGVLDCPKCGNLLEPDAHRCGECGWRNPLVVGGFI